MISLKEDQVVPIVLGIYNRIKLYRPHLSEEDRRELAQKKVLKDFGVSVNNEDLKKIVENQPTLNSAAGSHKCKTQTRERKRQSFTFNDIPLVETTDLSIRYENIQHPRRTSFTFKDIPFVKTSFLFTDQPISPTNKDQEDNETSINSSNFTTSKLLNTTSKIPVSVTKYGRKQGSGANNKRADPKTTKKQFNTLNDDKPATNVFDRLYQLRQKPCPQTVELVKKIRQTFAAKPASKQPLKTITCTSHEPPSKRGRYSKECLSSSDLKVPVFERLYAERKQLNTKKLTDVQKRELYLKKQREELRKAKKKKSRKNCHCGCSESLESATSDFDMNDFASDTDELGDNTDSTVVKFSDSVLTGDVFNSTLKNEDDYDSKNVQDLLNSLAERFNERMSLCVVNDSDLAD